MTDQDQKRPARKVHIDPDLLTPGDFRRGRVALGGRDPWEMLRGHQEDRAVFIGWALLSRDDPTLTLEDVDGWPFGAYVAEEEGAEDDSDRPPEAPSSTNGSGPKRNAAKRNDKPVSVSPSSAASTT